MIMTRSELLSYNKKDKSLIDKKRLLSVLEKGDIDTFSDVLSDFNLFIDNNDISNSKDVDYILAYYSFVEDFFMKNIEPIKNKGNKFNNHINMMMNKIHSSIKDMLDKHNKWDYIKSKEFSDTRKRFFADKDIILTEPNIKNDVTVKDINKNNEYLCVRNYRNKFIQGNYYVVSDVNEIQNKVGIIYTNNDGKKMRVNMPFAMFTKIFDINDYRETETKKDITAVKATDVDFHKLTKKEIRNLKKGDKVWVKHYGYGEVTVTKVNSNGITLGNVFYTFMNVPPLYTRTTSDVDVTLPIGGSIYRCIKDSDKLRETDFYMVKGMKTHNDDTKINLLNMSNNKYVDIDIVDFNDHFDTTTTYDKKSMVKILKSEDKKIKKMTPAAGFIEDLF